jgi:hypothetical protein
VSGLNQLTWDPNSAKNERLDNKHLSQKMEWDHCLCSYTFWEWFLYLKSKNIQSGNNIQ